MKHCLLLVMLAGNGLGIGCPKSMTDTAVIDSFCHAAQPIRWSRHDTPETIAQAKAHNRVWTGLCAKNGNSASAPPD
jgi:hypothetical protein